VPSLVRLRVPLGFAAALAYLLLARPTALTLALALPLVAAGEALRIAASGHIAKNRELATSGPYARVRHPLYLGSALVLAGFALAAAVPLLALALLALFAAVYLPVARREEARLGERFGAEFAAWRAAVPAFLPRLESWRPAPGEEGSFSWSAVRRHRELRAVAGELLLLGFLLARLLYTRPR
jgi:protein-S-isoprenylcysteine O-methyltransferase Ste14